MENTKRSLYSNLMGIVVFCFTIFSMGQLSWGALIDQNIWRIVLAGTAIALILLKIAQRDFIVDIQFILASMMLLIMLIWNNYDIKNSGIFVQFFNVLIFLFYFLIKDTNSWHSLAFKVLFIMGIFYAIMTYICIINVGFYTNVVYPIMSPLGYSQDNMAGFTSNYTTNGVFLSLGLISFSALFFYNSKKNLVLRAFLFIFLLIALLLSGKRGLSLSAILSLSIVYLLKNHKNKTSVVKLVLIFSIIIGILFVVSLILPEVFTIFDRFTYQKNKNDISTGRFEMWNTASKLFLEKPFIGYGWRWFRNSQYTINDYDVHNVYLQLLLETGVLGAFVFFVFFIYNIVIFLKVNRMLNEEKIETDKTGIIYGSITIQVFFLIMSLIGTTLYQIEFLIPYFISCAVCNYYCRQVKKCIR